MSALTETWCREKAATTLDPGRAENALAALSENWPQDLPSLIDTIESFPLGEDILLHLLAYSPITTEKLRRDPAALAWLAEPGICTEDRALWQMKADLAQAKDPDADFDPKFEALRRQKARETMRIALREISPIASIEQTSLEITLLAELCTSEVLDGWFGELSGRWGEPESQFTVLGMGKFGGSELNFSSDIDVIFIYSEDGQLNPRFTHKDFFTRLAEKIIGTFSAPDDAGPLFRIDLRLRPDGNSGPLVRSLGSMEHYYAAYGETWERMALIKARPVAGHEELGYEFLHHLQPFIFPRHLTSETLQEIAALKRRIDTELVAPDEQDRDIKRGHGGIREIEFVIQSLQLLYGSKHPFLQQQNTLKSIVALESLEDAALMENTTAETLADCYRFLRRLEHRIMIPGEQQTHLVPNDPEALQNLSDSLGFESVAFFHDRLGAVTRDVRDIFDAHFSHLAAPPPKEFDLSFFHNPEEAEKLIARLGGDSEGSNLSPRARRVFQGLKPSFLISLSYAAEPDMALNRFSRFVENYGIRATLYELLIQHPRLLELLTKLFDASSFVSEIAIRRPELVDEVARTGDIDHLKTVDDYLGELKAEAQRRGDAMEPGDLLRIFRNGELVRLALRDVLDLARLDDILLEYTALAEACVIHFLRAMGLEDQLTVIAMGKFGARELSYGSDLDVVFIGPDIQPARKLMAEFTRISEEGPLDEIDARLRPEGRSGVLVCPLEAYTKYFDKRADLWEAQALTKARVICGPNADEVMTRIREIWTRFGQDPDLFEGVRHMLDRIVEERGSDRDLDNFKTGHGGMIAIEFAVQAHQMRAGLWENSTLLAIGRLREEEFLTEEQASDLMHPYRFFRRVAFILRRLENRGASELPANESERHALARRLGYDDAGVFLSEYRDMRERAQRVTEALLS